MGPLILLLGSVAMADSSEPQEFVLSDSVELFTGAEYDSGWLPADGSIQLRFQIESMGTASVLMEGEATLYWPEAFSLALEGEQESGVLVLDAGLDLVTSVKFDISGYSWESELDRRGIDFAGTSIFEPFLLSANEPAFVMVEHQGESTELASSEVTVMTGVSLAFESEISTSTWVEYSGVAWTLEESRVDEPGVPLEVLLNSQPVWVEVEPWLQGEWSSQLDLVLTPSVSVCIDIIGCVELASFDIDIPLASEWIEQEISPDVLGFGVPRLEIQTLEIDLGEVEIGRQASAQIALENSGEADLEGSAGILGSADFSVFPASFSAGPGESDGVVVDFWPETEGEFNVDLVLESNDPYSPILQLSLRGTGVEPVVESTSEEVISASIRTCGCASLTTGRAPVWGFLIAILVGLRRRR